MIKRIYCCSALLLVLTISLNAQEDPCKKRIAALRSSYDSLYSKELSAAYSSFDSLKWEYSDALQFLDSLVGANNRLQEQLDQKNNQITELKKNITELLRKNNSQNKTKKSKASLYEPNKLLYADKNKPVANLTASRENSHKSDNAINQLCKSLDDPGLTRKK